MWQTRQAKTEKLENSEIINNKESISIKNSNEHQQLNEQMHNSKLEYELFLKIKDTWVEEQYICYLHLGNIYKSLNYDFKLTEKMYLSAIKLINDRAEAYYSLGILYNQTNNQEYSYKLLLQAKNIKFEEASKKYFLFLDSHCYGKYILDELSVACYWTNRIEEGIDYLSQIIDDPEMDQNRLQENMKHFKNKSNIFTI